MKYFLLGIIVCSQFSCFNNKDTCQNLEVKNCDSITEIGNFKPFTFDSFIMVKFDSNILDYYVENPCDGRIPTIAMTEFTLTDDLGMDQPIVYTINQRLTVDSITQLLRLSYQWGAGLLTDSLVIKQDVSCEGIYQLYRHPKYNGEYQDSSLNYFLDARYLNKTRSVSVDCPDEKLLEIK